ncbi:MAG: hypothetical protein V7752_17925, partial [Halopseudomonas sp.]
MVRRHIHHLRRGVVVSCVVLIFSIAATLSAGRWLMLNLMDYKAELEQLISDAPHFQVSFGDISGSWVVFSPRIEATSVKLTLQGGRRIDVGRMALQFDTLRSLWYGEAIFEQVLLDQLDLSLYRSIDKKWDLVGTALGQQPSSSQASGNPLP